MQFQCKGKKNFDKFFDKSGIKTIGRSSGFVKRKPKKITPYDLVLGFILMCSKGKNTFAEWALQIGFISGTTVSKQGVWSRINGCAAQFAEALLKHFLLAHSGLKTSCGRFNQFGKVLLQDSTVLKLPDELSGSFPGSTSRGKQRSQVRIQTIIDVKRMQFLYFSLSGFTTNDQSASGDVMKFAKKGDLVIRDLGYFVTQIFEDMLRSEVDFVSRLKYGLLLKTPSGKDIKLSGILKKKNLVDVDVLIGVRQIPVRLIMIPLPKSAADERVRKAKCDRDKRMNHSDEYYLWLRYNVIITTVSPDVWTSQQIAEVYGIRWQIEIIFKSWKSGAGLHKLLHERVIDAERVKVIIYLFLLFVCLFTKKIFIPLKLLIAKKAGKELSLMKAINFVMNNIIEAIGFSTNKLRRNMTLHCCYDLRTNRRTLQDLINNFKN